MQSLLPVKVPAPVLPTRGIRERQTAGIDVESLDQYGILARMKATEWVNTKVKAAGHAVGRDCLNTAIDKVDWYKLNSRPLAELLPKVLKPRT